MIYTSLASISSYMILVVSISSVHYLLAVLIVYKDDFYINFLIYSLLEHIYRLLVFISTIE